jgi:DNA-binding CsgD family transcriptional regulator
MHTKSSSNSAVALEQPEKTRATANASLKDPSVQTVFRSLISKLVAIDYNHSSTPIQAPLVEVEHEGQVYSLFCRKKQACPAFIELSPREKDIARMIATGLPNKTIAAVLEISEWTVSTHLRRIFAKLGVSCRAAMVSKWLESHALCKSGVTAHDLAANQVPAKTLFAPNLSESTKAETRFPDLAPTPQTLRADRGDFQALQAARKTGAANPRVRQT